MQKTIGLSAMCVFLLGTVPGASAQMIDWTDRAFINVSAAGQTRSDSLDANGSFPLYGETATYASSLEIGNGVLFDVSGGGRVWSNLGIGVGYSRLQDKAETTVSMSLPHPLFFHSPRSASAQVSGLRHVESGVHVFALWMVPVAGSVDVAVFGGPSIYTVTQDFVDVSTNINDPPPFTNPVVTATSRRESDTGVGGNVGVDIRYMPSRYVGVGLVVRYSRASVTVGGESLSAGGFQWGGGLRLRVP